MNTTSLTDLPKYLQLGTRFDLKIIALGHVTGVTATDEGVEVLAKNPAILASLISLLHDNSEVISEQVAVALINISATKKGAEALIHLDINAGNCPLQKPPENIICTVLKFIFDPKSKIADPCCMILSNLSRHSHLLNRIVHDIEKSGNAFEKLIYVFTKTKYNNNNATLDYLGPVLSNLSQSKTVRKYILDDEKFVLQRLLPFTEYKESLVRRKGVVGTLKNCCFETEFHEWLLSENVDILPRLLLPLAGSEELDPEENDKLPIELQYLDKDREEDPEIRCMLIEAIAQLCSKRVNREFIREKNAYVILRELHKWEKNENVLFALENLVDILIRTEEEIGQDNLKELEVPGEIREQFEKTDAEYLKSLG